MPVSPLPQEAQAVQPKMAQGLSASAVKQVNNPLHGVTLAAMVTALSETYGWEELGRRINIRCFTHEPSVSSSLKFLRKTPWAREKTESLYLFMLREQGRQGGKPPL